MSAELEAHVILRLSIAAVAAATLITLACGELPVACTEQFVPGIVVDVRDSSTGTSLSGAAGTAQDGAYTDSLRPLASTKLEGAGERPGAYTVTVSHAGYATWVRLNVDVQAGTCHVHTATLQALLQATS